MSLFFNKTTTAARKRGVAVSGPNAEWVMEFSTRLWQSGRHRQPQKKINEINKREKRGCNRNDRNWLVKGISTSIIKYKT